MPLGRVCLIAWNIEPGSEGKELSLVSVDHEDRAMPDLFPKSRAQHS